MIKVFGCGDLYIAKRLPLDGYKELQGIRDILSAHDVCFGNLETTLHYNEGYPSRFPGGGYAMAAPSCLQDLKKLGFNILNLANNHALDYSHKGLEATISHLNGKDFAFCGAGRNLAEASQPKYIECSQGRVAFIGVTSSFHDSDMAGAAGQIIPGRPGINPLRRTEYYSLTEDLYMSAKKIADVTGMNDCYDWSIRNGYRDEEQGVYLRELRFIKGKENGRITKPLDVDMERVKTSVREASIQSDFVIVSLHTHQMNLDNLHPAEFVKEFCHECIEAGANAIFGHGPHEIRGMEIYKGGAIFYGLGDFILHNEMQLAMPYEFYEKTGVEGKYYDYVGIAMEKRSKKGTIGLQADVKAWQSIGTGIEVHNGEIAGITVYPITLGYELGRTMRGWPALDQSGEIIEYFSTLSAEYGTNVDIDGNIGHVLI